MPKAKNRKEKKKYPISSRTAARQEASEMPILLNKKIVAKNWRGQNSDTKKLQNCHVFEIRRFHN